jgi:hypothetical protein
MRDFDHQSGPPAHVQMGTSRRRVVAGSISLLASALLLAACGSGSSSTSSEFLSTKQTRAAIEESILTQRHIHATVVCPTEVVREKGVTFQCVATTPNGAKTVFHVVEANSRGYVEYSSAPEKKQNATKSTRTSTTRHKKS